jgi:Mg2+ and Co2+ transporter CorA
MQSNRLIKTLTIIGAFAFPISLLLAFFGANFSGENGARTFSIGSFLVSAGVIVAGLFTAYSIILNRWEKKRKQ